MGFLKRLFGGGGTANNDTGIYVYIRIKRTGEIVQVRVNRGAEISRNDNGNLFVRKLVMGTSSFDKAEATIYFNRDFRVTNADISGGELATRDDYLAQQAESAD